MINKKTGLILVLPLALLMGGCSSQGGVPAGSDASHLGVNSVPTSQLLSESQQHSLAKNADRKAMMAAARAAHP